MEEQQKVTSHIVKGLAIGLILVALSLLGSFNGAEQPGWSKWLSNIILFGGIVAGCIIYSNQMNNNVTFGNVFVHGFKLGAVITCVMIVFTISFLMLNPDIKQVAMNAAREEMEKQNKMSEEEIESAIKIIGKFFYVFAIGGIAVVYLFISVIAALLGAAVSKKNPQTPFQQ